jgi:hypothetical protein
MKRCHKCGEEWTRQNSPGFRETCPKCVGFLHACLNCRLYNPSADRCSSVTAECTGERDSLNYCEEFQFKDAPSNHNHSHNRSRSLEVNGRASNRRLSNGSSRGEKSGGRDKFNELFGNKL